MPRPSRRRPPPDSLPFGRRLWDLAIAKHTTWRQFELDVEAARTARGRHSWAPSRPTLNKWLKLPEARVDLDGLMWLARWFNESREFVMFGELTEDDIQVRELSDDQLDQALRVRLVTGASIDSSLQAELHPHGLSVETLTWALPTSPLRTLVRLYRERLLEEVERITYGRRHPQARAVQRMVEDR